jgi:hypothetical protein
VIRTASFYVNTETETAVEIFYRNIRTVSIKQTELFDNVGYVHFQNISLTEILLNDISFDHKLFPDVFTTFRFHRVNSTKSSDAVLRAVSRTVFTFKK